MNTREMTTEYRMSQWAKILHERRESGEGVGEFCERRGISRNVYFYWQKKLRERLGKELMPALTEEASQNITPQGWALCKQSEPKPPESSITLEIGAFRISVGENASTEQLEKVCRVLKSLC